jgi:hypothetical protein
MGIPVGWNWNILQVYKEWLVSVEMREHKVPLELESKENLVNKALPARVHKARLEPVLKVQLVLERRG